MEPRTDSPHPVRYAVKFDADWLVDAMRHQFRTRPVRRVLFPATLAVGTVLFIGFIFYGFFRADLGTAVLGLVALPAIWLILPLTYAAARAAHRRSPYNDDLLAISLDADGFHCVSEKQDVHLTWDVYTAAHRFPDGLLLCQGRNLFNWLPDAALEEGSTASAADSLAAAHIAKFQRHQ